jgi:hypothetical protein
MSLSRDEFLQQRLAIRGTGNGQRMHVPLWEKLVRSGEPAHFAAHDFGIETTEGPGWCFDRFGTTRTRLPDGRIICIAGEHEDHYDPDFFIYNDAIVIHPGGEIEIYGYAPHVFPPTDFHSATLIGEWIYLIGALGYFRARGAGPTPAYRLNTRSMRIEPVLAEGQDPGWIYGHAAELATDGRTIRVSGGQVLYHDSDGKEAERISDSSFVFDTVHTRWSRDDQAAAPPGKLIDLSGWTSIGTWKEVVSLRYSIMRAVAPEHPLF